MITYHKSIVEAHPRLEHRDVVTLLCILAAALILRLTAILAFPSLHHADENNQFFEQAHRIAFGYGITPWEFRDGVRSLLLPGVFAKVFTLVDALGGGPRAYIFVSRLLLAFVSLLSVAAVYFAGLRQSRTHALIVGSVAATWFELVYFAGRPLTEAIATTFLIVALSMTSAPRDALTTRRLIAIGFCVGSCLMLRVHLAVGLVVIACWIGRYDVRTHWLPMIIGCLIPIAAFGASDWIVWGSPFHSQIAAFRINVIENKASKYGTEPFYWFAKSLIGLWAGALPVILALAAVRYRKSALWLLVAAAIIAAHSLIPHKEYRFVYPAFACLVLVAAMGSADIVLRLQNKMGPEYARVLKVGAVTLWIATSACLAFAPGFSSNWFRGRELINASYWLSDQSSLCGLLLYDYGWDLAGGYAYLHRNVPIYPPPTDQDTARQGESAFNFVILKRSSLPVFSASFIPQHCVGRGNPSDLCVVARKGICTPDDSLHPLLLDRHLGEGVPKKYDRPLESRNRERGPSEAKVLSLAGTLFSCALESQVQVRSNDLQPPETSHEALCAARRALLAVWRYACF